MRRALALAALLALAATPGCGSGLNLPVTGRHADDEEPVSVPTPPPPGKVEIIAKPPANLKDPVWIDGEMDWTGRRWQWREGRWEVPPPDSYYAPPATVRRADGSLAHYKGAWKKGKPKK